MQVRNTIISADNTNLLGILPQSVVYIMMSEYAFKHSSLFQRQHEQELHSAGGVLDRPASELREDKQKKPNARNFTA